MSELRFETLQMPAADLGPENLLPSFQKSYDADLPTSFPNLSDEMNKNMAMGRLSNYLPYTMQDGYDRKRRPRDFTVAVLENEHLRATFLLELGGRLWSLVHKSSGRELLDVNPIFQPANLAMRNAWFAGGVEWNIGMIAHSAFTCSPLFAAQVENPEGLPILRLYEWERIRRVPFQIDAYLPPDSQMLFIRVRIINPHDLDIPMYWWSNIAVPESDDLRVLVPADSAYRFSSERDALQVVPVPIHNDQDISYPTGSDRSIDYFFELESHNRPWITALDSSGKGLVHVSTQHLRGRKLFIWGQGVSGQNWQQFLSVPGHTYIELQAGLARTQLEHVRMPAKTEWSWLEGYGLLEAESGVIHGKNWDAAVQEVETKLSILAPSVQLQAELERSATWVDLPPTKIVQRGSGWGALEAMRRKIAGESSPFSDGLVFNSESLGEPQAPWITLLQTGEYPLFDVDAAPNGYVVDSEWRDLLQTSLDTNPKSGWMAWLHLGIMHYAAGDKNAAERAWNQSVQDASNPWALRNLATLAREAEQYEKAAELLLEAHQLKLSLIPLTIELAQALLDSDQPQRWLDILRKLPADTQAMGRIRLLEADAALAIGDFERVEQVFSDQIVVNDLREGERSLSQLWFDYHEKRLRFEENIPEDEDLTARIRQLHPVPKHLEFRMGVD